LESSGSGTWWQLTTFNKSLNGDYILPSSEIVENNWEYVVAKFNGTHQFIYINGNLLRFEEVSWKSALNDNDNDLLITGSESRPRYLDDIMIYNRDLSSAEIKTLYDYQKRKYMDSIVVDYNESLVGWWRFDGDYLDSSGNGNDGTCTNCPEFVNGMRGEGIDQIKTGCSGDDMKIMSTDYNFINSFSISTWVNADDLKEVSGGGNYIYSTGQWTGQYGYHLWHI